jgi:hypothetical protein
MIPAASHKTANQFPRINAVGATQFREIRRHLSGFCQEKNAFAEFLYFVSA